MYNQFLINKDSTARTVHMVMIILIKELSITLSSVLSAYWNLADSFWKTKLSKKYIYLKYCKN